MIGIISYLLLMILVGSIICFKGKQLFFPIIMAETFLSTEIVSIHFLGFNLKGILIGTVLGIVFALIARFVYKAAIFIGGFIGGALVSTLLIAYLPQSIAKFGWIIVLLTAFVVGICAVKWNELFIAISTASSGALSIATSLCFLAVNFKHLNQFIYADGTVATILHLSEYLRNDFVVQNAIIVTGVSVILFAIGFIAQQKQKLSV